MSTLQQTYDAIVSDDAQKRAFVEAMRAGRATGFLRGRGCDVAEEELEEFRERAIAMSIAALRLDAPRTREAFCRALDAIFSAAGEAVE